VNLSSHDLTPSDLSLLNKGLSFIPSHTKANTKQLHEDIQRFNRKLQLHYFFSTIEGLPSQSDDYISAPLFKPASTWIPKNRNRHIDILCEGLESDITAIVRKKPEFNLTKDEINSLYRLKQNKDITIKKADKGGSIAVMNSFDYVEKINYMLSDTNTYKPLDYIDPNAIKTEADWLLDDLRTEGYITDDQFKYLTSFEPRIPVFYGLPKLHKANIPLRPVVSQINGPTCMVNTLVDKLLVTAEKQIPYILQDTTAFLNIIEEHKHVQDNTILVTLDVSSMYTNIPHHEGVRNVCDFYEETLENWNTNLTGIKPIPVSKLKLLMEFILKNCQFSFGERMYLQIQGTTMGAKFSVRYANIFMHVWLRNHLALYSGPKPPFISRLVDDIFFLWNHGNDELDNLFTFLNTCHQTIKFEINRSTEHIQFLDTVIMKKDNQLSSTIYTKPTDRKQYLYFQSCHPRHVIRSIPYAQSIRYRRNISNDTDFQLELEKLKTNFLARGYPLALLNSELARSVNIVRTNTLQNTTKAEKRAKFIDRLGGRTFLPLIITYYNQYKHGEVRRAIKKRWKWLISTTLQNKQVFEGELPQIVYKKGISVSNTLVRAKTIIPTNPLALLLSELADENTCDNPPS